MNRAALYDGFRMWGVAGLPPVKVATLLADLAGQLDDLETGVLARYEVHPAAVALRDVLVRTLEGIDRLSRYETYRMDARRLGGRLEFVVDGLRWKVGERHDVDLVKLGAYEDELAAQEEATAWSSGP